MTMALGPEAPIVAARNEAEASDTSLVILQSLLCMLREKNLLTRADIEELTQRIRTRVAEHDRDPLPCCIQGVTKAAEEMSQIDTYLGRRYGGKHRRQL